MDETETPREDWRDWYRMTSFERMEEGLSDQADLEPDFSRETFLEWRRPRSGTENPTRVHSPVWEWFVRTGLSAYSGNDKFQGPSSFGFEPCWCNDRMGQRAVDLPDGRLVLIAGEHEDYYDPDFYIYNDTIVLHKDGEVEILGYPRELFPPTDFHTATLAGGHIIIIGNLGYSDDRMPGQTQVFTLNVRTLSMSRVATTGECPGWISRHTAELSADGNSIVVKGGEIWRADATLLENLDEWKLRLDDWRWERLSRRLWPRWILERTDEKRLHLSEYSNVKWYRQVKWDAEKEKASLRDSLKGEPDEEAYDRLYQPPVIHSPSKEDADDSRTVRITLDGVTVRYNSKGSEVIITIEGELPADIADGIVEDCRNKLERVERSSVRATRIAAE